MTPNKPVVHYTTHTNTGVVVGRCVSLEPLDHTSVFVSNARPALTSPVVSVLWDHPSSVADSPVFETLNTVYIPAEQKQEVTDGNNSDWD